MSDAGRASEAVMLRAASSEEAAALADHLARVRRHLHARIEATRERGTDWSFADFMNEALYAPGLGYYAAGLYKFGVEGDFVTAPELTPLFGRTLGRGLADFFSRDVLELGAGSGALAESILAVVAPVSYRILEPSADLALRQRRRLEACDAARIEWLTQLPERLDGVIIANEVLDAVPCELVRHAGGEYWRGCVDAQGDGGFALRWKRLPEGALRSMAEQRLPPIEGYVSEVNPQAEALVATLAGRLADGVGIFIDYGFPRREYYLAERRDGTLACHGRHRVHFDPFARPGLDDLTAHVDFTAMAEAAVDAGCEVVCYAPLGQLLLALGLMEMLTIELEGTSDERSRTRILSAVHRLTSPAEMGELFKALIVGRGASARSLAERLSSIDQSFRL